MRSIENRRRLDPPVEPKSPSETPIPERKWVSPKPSEAPVVVPWNPIGPPEFPVREPRIKEPVPVRAS